ncbi:Uncharacterised protein [Shigella sonnei]|nr:Uncharacterised protein [Shigella sonnei]
MRACSNAKRRRLRQRVTQHLLKQHAHQPQARAHQQRNRQTRQQAVVKNHLLDDIDVWRPGSLRPLATRQRLREVHPGERRSDNH